MKLEDDNSSRSSFARFLRQLAAGGGAGAISRTLTAPVERIKVVLQVQAVASIPESQKFKGISDCFFGIYRQQGIPGYWRGNGINVLRIVPNSAIKFATFDQYKKLAFPEGEKAYEDRKKEKILRKMFCGGLAGASTMIPVYPLDLARTKLSADTTGKYRGMVHLFKQTVDANGVRGLYSGIGISLCGIIPYLAISLTSYDTLKEVTANYASLSSLPGRVMLGSIAAIISQSIAYPIDTIRRHMQVSGGLGQRAKYLNTTECIKEIYRLHGIKGYYRGILINVTRAAPQTGIEFACFDFLSSFLRNL